MERKRGEDGENEREGCKEREERIERKGGRDGERRWGKEEGEGVGDGALEGVIEWACRIHREGGRAIE